MRAFDWHQIYRPWMTLNGRNAPVADDYAEIKSSYEAHKKLNEDRRKLTIADRLKIVQHA